jgi:GT2 family glycosyltransferase
MKTTVVIISSDEAPLLRHSLPAAVAQDDAEVVVADNGSGDETAELAGEHGAELIRFDRRLSYVDATNEALARTGGDAVLLLNPDCFLAPGFLAAARPRLAETGVGAVAPKLVRTLGPLPEQRLDALDTAGMAIDRRRKNGLVGHGRPSLAYDRPAEAFGVDGAAALYRRETLEECALDGEVLDPDFERWASDVDLAWRAQTLGWRCVYEPGALAWHIRHYSPSTRAGLPEADRRLQFRNRYLMIAKNDRPSALLRDLPRVLAYEIAALGYAILVERHLLRGYPEAARRLPAALRRRRALRVARRRRAAPPAPLGLEPPP